MTDLEYPMARVPAVGGGDAVAIAPGVFWLRMPLAGSLRFINVWALAEADGWTLIDTGVCNDVTKASWEAALVGALAGRPVIRVIATHMHPDHCGLAGWFGERFAAPLWMTRLEYLTCRVLAADTGRPAPAAAIDFYRAAGWDDAALEHYRGRFGGFGRMIFPLPESYRRMEDGQTLKIGGRDWRVVVGSGHCPEHACLYCPELNLLISGDQVLPRISSNVSVFATEPLADPLNDWMTSIDRLAAVLPGDVLVLPAHNDPFIGLHARLAALHAGHVQALSRLEAFLDEPRRVVDVFSVLFRRSIGHDVLTLATGESLAHLNRLLHSGRARVARDADGVGWWQSAGQAQEAAANPPPRGSTSDED